MEGEWGTIQYNRERGRERERERERVRCLFPSPTNIKKMMNLCQNFIKQKELSYPRDILL
jgi:hypothetical protein